MPVLPVGPAPAATGAPRPSFGDAIRARLTPDAAAGAPPGGAAEGSRGRGPGTPSPAARMLAAVEEARARLDAVLSEARRGRTFSAGELLALQAEAHRAARTLEVASKVVEQGAQSVKQAVNTPV